MSEWKECRLKDVTHGNGTYGIAASAVPKDDNKYTYLRITDINDDGSLNSSDLRSVDDPNADRYLLSPNDIVFARTGNSTGRTYFYDGSDGKLVFAGFLIKFSLDPNKVNPKILKYYTHSKEYYDWVASFDSGATRGNINAKTYAEMLIKLPPRNVQDSIVFILSSLDEKIETNRKINARLEELVQALFKSWFIDFEPFGGNMPEDWQECNLSDILIVKYGKDHKNLGDGIVPVYGSGGIMRYVDKFLYDKESVLIPRKGSLNNLFYVDTPFWSVDTMFFTEMKKCNIAKYIFLYLKRLDFVSMNCGSAIPSMTANILNSLKITLPSDDILTAFEEVIKPVFLKIKQSLTESARLAALRDTLLPKLMSGELIPE